MQTDSHTEHRKESRPLLQAYETLAQHAPFTSLLDGPTPVDRFNREMSKPSNLHNLWVKRDDQTNALYGGNKVRKLEFILPQAKANTPVTIRPEIVTLGAIGTNHGVATAIFCQQHDIDCRIYLFDQPLSDTVRTNLKLMAAHKAQLEYRGGVVAAALAYYRAQLFDRRSYFLPPGGSNIAGCLGFVNAAFELKQQIDAGELPEPDHIICAVGSSGTLAGLTLGCELAGLKTRVHGIRVAPARVAFIPVCTRETIAALQQKTYQFLRSKSNAIPDLTLRPITLEQNYYGAGYGHPTAAGDEATALFLDRGIQLESTYTAKAAAATLAYCNANPEETVLYWHTFNSASVEVPRGEEPIEAVPMKLRSHLAK